MKKRPSFFSGLQKSLFHNLPLLLCGILLFLIGLFTEKILLLIGCSLFICYFLSCAYESVFSVTSAKMFDDDVKKENDDPPDTNHCPSGASGEGAGEGKE